LYFSDPLFGLFAKLASSRARATLYEASDHVLVVEGDKSMLTTRNFSWLTALLASASFLCSGAHAAMFNGTAYYTDFSNGTVHTFNYSYNDVSHAFTTSGLSLVATLPGADGIIFAPNGNLLVGGQGTNKVFNVDKTAGTFTSASAGTPSFHLALAPNGQSVYTSNFGGPLQQVPLSNFGTANPPITTAITGSETGLTQLAFAAGKTFYVNGQPNGNGNVGTIDLTTGVTTRLAGPVLAAHGIIFDPSSGLIDLFGAGNVATIDPNSLTVSTSVHFLNAAGDFDQGSPDGLGHALIAGSGGFTFIDYENTSILTPNFVTFITSSNGVGFGNVDDIAPLSGLGSNTNVPLPGALPLFTTGLAGLVLLGWRRKKKIDAGAV
jgi:hypothetical protein